MSIRDEEKLRLFTDEALGSAEDTADRINKETNDEESRLLAEGEHKILTEAYEKIQSELKNIRRDNSRELSRETMIKRRELLLYREEIMQNVFDAAREKIEQFTASKEYGNYLVKLATNVLSKQSASFTLFLSPRDLRYKYAILEGLAGQKHKARRNPLLLRVPRHIHKRHPRRRPRPPEGVLHKPPRSRNVRRR